MHDNDSNSYLFVNGSQELQFKSTINYLDRNLLCLGNISSDWTQTNSTKPGLYGNVYEFVPLSVDYVPLSGIKTIYDIHRYLMKKHNILMFNLLKKVIILIMSLPLTLGYCLLLKTIYDIHRYLMKKHNILMFNFLKKVIILIMSLPLTLGYCLLLKNQECKVRKIIIDKYYMTFPYKININRCIGSCNNKNNPYFKTCLPNSIKNITVKILLFRFII